MRMLLMSLLAAVAWSASFALASPASQPTDLTGKLFGDLSEAHRVTFVIDASGSMLNVEAHIKAELLTTIEQLKPSQEFDVIVFGGSRVDMLAEKCLPADGPGKKKAAVFIEGYATDGLTDPIPAMVAAIMLHPDRICLLTDGGFEDDRLKLAASVYSELGKTRTRIDAVVWQDIDEVAPLMSLRLITRHTAGVLQCVKPRGPALVPLDAGDPPPQNLEAAGFPDDMRPRRIDLAGVPSGARSVVFICDRAMSAPAFRLSQDSLLKSIGELNDEERFAIVCFGDGDTPTMLAPTLQLALAKNRRRSADWVQGLTPAITARPPKDDCAAAAVDWAFRRTPEAIYLIIPPEFDTAQVVEKVFDLNKRRIRPVEMNAVIVLDHPLPEPAAAQQKVDVHQAILPVPLEQERTDLEKLVSPHGALGYIAPSSRPSSSQ